jgi:phosphate transport system permease protein
MSQLAETTAPVPTRPWRNSKATATRNFVAVFLALTCGALINKMTGLSGFLGFFVGSAMLLPIFVAVSNLKRGANVVIDRLASAVIAVAFIAVTIPWLSIFVTVFQKGSEAFHWGYLTDDMRITPSGDELQYGGIAHAIVGTMLMVLVATVISVPFGIIAAIYIVEVKGRFSDMIRLLVQAMSGVPSIVAGLFVYSTVVVFFGSFSAWAGALALSILMLPTVARTSEEVLKLVPADLRDSSAALGATQARTVFTVVIPTVASGLITAAVLGVARVVGETAPLILTSSYFVATSTNLNQPIASLPIYIFSSLGLGDQNATARAWGGALVLLGLVFFFFLLTRIFSSRIKRK